MLYVLFLFSQLFYNFKIISKQKVHINHTNTHTSLWGKLQEGGKTNHVHPQPSPSFYPVFIYPSPLTPLREMTTATFITISGAAFFFCSSWKKKMKKLFEFCLKKYSREKETKRIENSSTNTGEVTGRFLIFKFPNSWQNYLAGTISYTHLNAPKFISPLT